MEQLLVKEKRFKSLQEMFEVKQKVSALPYTDIIQIGFRNMQNYPL